MEERELEKYMAFTKYDLLLDAAKLAQLTKALANTGVADPVQSCVNEGIAEVERLTSGYVIADAAKYGWIRALALFKAYSLAGPVPEDVQKQYDGAIKQLEAIATGAVKNLPVAASESGSNAGAAGKWGSGEKIK